MKKILSIMRDFIFVIVFSVFFLTSCSEYWWQRGQNPHPLVIAERGKERFDEVIAKRAVARKDIAGLLKNASSSLTSILDFCQLEKSLIQLDDLKRDFELLEGKLSIPSRAAYGELSGQIRVLSRSLREGVSKKNCETIQLLVGRIYQFMARELQSPMPKWTA